MTESRQSREGDARASGDTGVFNQLEGLSRDEAERVLERAIKLSDNASPSGDGRLSIEDISRVAAELGISAATVERAVREEMREPRAQPRRRSDALLGPKRVSGRMPVTGTPREVAETVAGWMVTEEGLRPVSRSGESVRWEKDDHWVTSLRLAAGSDATKVLRGLSSVTHRQRGLGPDEQLVELEADTSRVRIGAGATGASVAAFAGIGGGIGVAAGIPGGNDLVQFLYVAIPMAGVGLATTKVVAKAWTSAVEKGIDRALAGISQPDLYARAKKRWQRRMSLRRNTRERGAIGKLSVELKGIVDDFLER